MMFYEDNYISPLDLPTDHQKNFYNWSLEINGEALKETIEKLKDSLNEQQDTTISILLDRYVNQNPKNNLHNNKENETMKKRIRVGDLVTDTSRPDFGVGIVIGEKANEWFVVKFPNFWVRPQSVHIKDLLPYKPNGLLGLRSDYMCFDDVPDNFLNVSMPDIINYNYNEDTTVTTIEWSDGTKTTVRAEFPDTASQHEGFMVAYAKKAAGNNNTINNLYEEWAVKKPAREQKAQIKANAERLEEQRIAKKRKAKKEQWLIRKRAAEIDKEYKAKKLANEKYGVPMDFKVGDTD